MATQAVRRATVGRDTFAYIVYALAFAIGIISILIGVLSDFDSAKTQAGFIALGLWAIVSTCIAIAYRATHHEIAVRGSSDETGGPRIEVLARIGVDGWAFWTIFGLLVAAVVAIIAWPS